MPGTDPVPSVNGVNSRPRSRLVNRLVLHISALLLFLLFFAGTVLVLFPQAPLKAYAIAMIQQRTGQDVSIGELSFSPFLRLEAKQIAWQPPVSHMPRLLVDRLTLSPQILSLLGKVPACLFRAAVADGAVEGRFDREGSLEATLFQVHIAPFFAADFPFPASGSIDGSIAAEKRGAAGAESAAFDLQLTDLQVRGMGVLGLQKGDLSLGRLLLQGKMTGKNVNIEELRNEGGDLALSVHGIVLLDPIPDRCRLSLEIELRPGAALTQSLKDLMQLVGLKAASDGSYRFRLAGTLAKPILR